VDLLVDLHQDMDPDTTMEDLEDLDLDILAILPVDLLAAMEAVDMVDLLDLVDQAPILQDQAIHHLDHQGVTQLLAVILHLEDLLLDILHHQNQDSHHLDLHTLDLVDLMVVLVDLTVVLAVLIVDMEVLTVDQVDLIVDL